MHAALLTNIAWLDEELPTLRQLVVGLIDEQVRVAQVVPAGQGVEDVLVFGQPLTWRESSVEAIDRWRLSAMAPTLDKLGVDVVHALDGRLWGAAVKLGRAMDSAIVLGANARQDVRPARRIAAKVDPARVAFIAATASLAQGLRERLGPAQSVRCIPSGVHVPPQPHLPRPAGSPTCVVISGNGRCDDDYEALLDAMAQVVGRRPQTHLFFDGQGGDQHTIWQAARQRHLLSNASIVPRRLGHRELLLRADALILPQAQGRARSLALLAYAAGVPVLARLDPWLDDQIDQKTVWAVEQPTAARWLEVVMRLIDKPGEAAALGQSARDWVGEHRPASAQVRGVLEVYRAVTGATIPFPGAGG